MTPIQRVAAMNIAFGNPKGDYSNIDLNRVRRQTMNVFDEYCETLKALGLNPRALQELKDAHADIVFIHEFTEPVDLLQARDGLCDIQVFAGGSQHFMGVDGDADMHAVLDGVMTRFVKDQKDLSQTVAKHAGKGVTEVYTEGEFPTMVLKSAADQPDAPAGKFLKSASYRETVFPEVL